LHRTRPEGRIGISGIDAVRAALDGPAGGLVDRPVRPVSRLRALIDAHGVG
jgi:hypothetical protein